MKKLFQYFPQGSALYILLHGQWARSRGRGLSATSTTQKNPRKAYQEASAALDGEALGSGFAREDLDAKEIEKILDEVAKRLGVRFLTFAEVMSLLRRQNPESSLLLASWEGDVWHKTWQPAMWKNRCLAIVS